MLRKTWTVEAGPAHGISEGTNGYYKGLDKASFCTSCETVTKVDAKDNGLILG